MAKKQRKVKRVDESRPAAPAAAETLVPNAATAAAPGGDATPAAAATPAATVETPRPRAVGDDVEKFTALNDGRRFLVERMQKGNVAKFRALLRNTPELLDPTASSSDDPAFALDLSGWIGQGYDLLFVSLGAILVKTKRIRPDRAAAFLPTQKELEDLIPLTERAVDEQFGAKIRNLPPMAALGLSILGLAGKMYQRAATDAPIENERLAS